MSELTQWLLLGVLLPRLGANPLAIEERYLKVDRYSGQPADVAVFQRLTKSEALGRVSVILVARAQRIEAIAVNSDLQAGELDRLLAMDPRCKGESDGRLVCGLDGGPQVYVRVCGDTLVVHSEPNAPGKEPHGMLCEAGLLSVKRQLPVESRPGANR